MIDYVMQVFEQRLVQILEQARYEELGPEDASRIGRSLSLALEAPSLVQGARELLSLLDDQPELEAVEGADGEIPPGA